MTTTARMRAAERGKVTYLGKPCRRCGGRKRYVTSATCVVCAKAAAKRARQALQETLAKRGE